MKLFPLHQLASAGFAILAVSAVGATGAPDSGSGDAKQENGAQEQNEKPSKYADESASDLWSLQPLDAAKPPQFEKEAWPATEIDRYVYARMQENGLEPMEDADRTTWIRRVTFDLIGLPPKPEHVKAFLEDESPKAKEKVVDRLLASKHFVASLEADPRALSACRSILSPGERERADRFHFDRDRRRFTAARATLRRVLAERTGTPPESLAIETDRHGKPFLAPPESPLHFNVSHSEERVLIGLSREAPLGVDIEDFSHAHRLPAMGERICAPAEWDRLAGLPVDHLERELLRLWTAKESFLKAAGAGFQVDPRRIEIPPSVTGGKSHSGRGALAGRAGARGPLPPLPPARLRDASRSIGRAHGERGVREFVCLRSSLRDLDPRSPTFRRLRLSPLLPNSIRRARRRCETLRKHTSVVGKTPLLRRASSRERTSHRFSFHPFPTV